MKEYKFRAWDKEINKMFYFDSNLCIKFNGEIFALHNIEYTSIEQNTLELMQYTGLKDKNGAEIFEGDIVRILYTDWGSKPCSDKRTLDEYLDSIANIGMVEFKNDRYTVSGHSIICGQHGYIKVIGNKYEG